MSKLNVFNVLGEQKTTININKNIFDIKPHNQAMFDVVLAERSLLRQGTHGTKNRTQVAGGGKKPWRQKGTGRARQGSIRSPQWRGGGVVFGPTPLKNYKLKINKKVKKLALKSGWSLKIKEKQVMIIEDISFKKPSSKDFAKMLINIDANEKKVLLILNGDKKEYNTFLSARNLANVMPIIIDDLMLDDILNSSIIIMTEKTLRNIEGRLE